ncbi:MAG: hypothetical protein OEW37_07445 [Rhodospirillaceae bacterium]|nr:hypothetical protein [Rhodospirillaceae bacterium]
MKIGENNIFSTAPNNGVRLRPEKQPGQKLVVVEDPLPLDTVKGSGINAIEHPLEKILENTNSRNMSPRQAAKLGLDLYAAGILKWDEYSDFSFQPELHPEYNKTIGALTGESARPDTKRDFIKIWDEKYRFAVRHAGSASDVAERALHILSVLRRIENPTDTKA